MIYLKNKKKLLYLLGLIFAFGSLYYIFFSKTHAKETSIPKEATYLTIHYIIPHYTQTVNAGDHITIYGHINKIDARDPRSGETYSYYVLHTATPYRLKEEDDIDDSNITPTTFISIMGSNEAQVAQDFGQYVKIEGTLTPSNGGGPQLDPQSITLEKEDL